MKKIYYILPNISCVSTSILSIIFSRDFTLFVAILSFVKKVIKSNIEVFWKPADLIQKMLIAVSDNNVHNLTIDQILFLIILIKIR